MAMTRHNSNRLITSIINFSCFFSSSSFDPPPILPSRRVVVTGLGMVTPLGCGVEVTWKRLIEGECGIRAITVEDLKMNGFDRETQLYTFDQLTSKVAGVVPCGSNPGEFNEEFWLNSKDHRSIARFIGYALCAADEALRDANYMPTKQDEKERTGVSIGAGTGSISDILDASKLICEKKLRRLSPFFIPRILINMASGHVSMKYGFQDGRHGKAWGIAHKDGKPAAEAPKKISGVHKRCWKYIPNSKKAEESAPKQEPNVA